MRTYRKSDGTEINDLKDRDINWVTEQYGDGFIEIPQPIIPILTPNQIRVIEIDSQLQKIDDKSIRALRTSDSARITSLENQAIALRTERATLV